MEMVCALFDAFLIICWHAIRYIVVVTIDQLHAVGYHSLRVCVCSIVIQIFTFCTSLNRSHLLYQLVCFFFLFKHGCWYLKFYTNIWFIFSLLLYYLFVKKWKWKHEMKHFTSSGSFKGNFKHLCKWILSDTLDNSDASDANKSLHWLAQRTKNET